MGVEHRVTAPYHPEANGELISNYFLRCLVFTKYIHDFKGMHKIVKVIKLNIFPTFAGMIERLSRTMTQSLRVCINDQKDWIVVLQSIAMSYRST